MPKALTSRIKIDGVPRQYFVMNVIFFGAMALGGQVYLLPAIMAPVLHMALKVLTEIDDWLIEVLIRHLRQPSVFNA